MCQEVQSGMFAKNLLNIQHDPKLDNIYRSTILATEYRATNENSASDLQTSLKLFRKNSELENS